MQIGFIKQESMSVKKPGVESEVVKWLECHFRIAGVRPFSAKMTVNNRKTEPKQPDYIIYLRANVNKGDTFRDIPIGSLWLGEKMIDGVLKKFMTGTLEVIFKKVSIAVWKAEPRYDGEVINYLYDIKTMDDNRQSAHATYQDDDDNYSYTPPSQYETQQQPTYHHENIPADHTAYKMQAQQARPMPDKSMIPGINIDEDEIPF